MSTIEDVRAVQGTPNITYSFQYSTVQAGDRFPHLTQISNSIQTTETYTLTYATQQALRSPFDGASYGSNWTSLGAITSGANTATGFTYDNSNSGELTKVALPYGGYLRWAYTPYTMASRTLREVYGRYLNTAARGQTGTEATYGFYRADDHGSTFHIYADLVDFSGNGEKVWWFQDTSTFHAGLVYQFEERQFSPVRVAMRDIYSTWAQDPGPAPSPYISTNLNVIINADASQLPSQTTQTLDQWGNVLSASIYDYGNLATPARVYRNTMNTATAYTAAYIRNLVQCSTVANSGQFCIAAV